MNSLRTHLLARTIALTLSAQVIAPLVAMAGDGESKIYTSRVEIAPDRVIFRACYHLDGFSKERCETVGNPGGYSSDQLQRFAEKARDTSNTTRGYAAPAGYTLTGLAVTAGTLAGGFYRFKHGHAYSTNSKTDQVLLTGAAGAFYGLMGGGVTGLGTALGLNILADSQAAVTNPLKEPNSDTQSSFAEYKARLRSALGRIEPVAGAAPSLSDALLKDLDADGSEVDAAKPAASVAR